MTTEQIRALIGSQTNPEQRAALATLRAAYGHDDHITYVPIAIELIAAGERRALDVRPSLFRGLGDLLLSRPDPYEFEFIVIRAHGDTREFIGDWEGKWLARVEVLRMVHQAAASQFLIPAENDRRGAPSTLRCTATMRYEVREDSERAQVWEARL
jgi:hypothetical protein